MKVAFQGVPGAYSELAAFQFFGAKAKPMPYAQFAEVFHAVLDGRVAFGIIPIENSLAGSILQNYDLLVGQSVWICGETKLRVSHSLIAHPKAKLGDIRRVYSHPQALAQCRRFLQRWGRVEAVPYFDTAGSVKFLAAEGARDAAAIASRQSAARYGMRVLKAGIEDDPQNFTRFLIIARKRRQTPGVRPGELPIRASVHRELPGTAKRPKARRCKSSIALELPNRAGALHAALGIFAAVGISLTKIESRPIAGRPWEYLFYLDFDADAYTTHARQALALLEEMAIGVKLLGSYPASKENYL